MRLGLRLEVLHEGLDGLADFTEIWKHVEPEEVVVVGGNRNEPEIIRDIQSTGQVHRVVLDADELVDHCLVRPLEQNR